MEQTLAIKTGIQVLKPAPDIFEAIIDPEKMKNYFISKSSGLMKEGETLIWRFAEVDMEFPVKICKIEKDKYISFEWDGAMDGENTLVEIHLKPKPGNATQVTVTEKSKPVSDVGIKWLGRNSEGWANFLACMKAWLEYGIHLRKGAFDPAEKTG